MKHENKDIINGGSLGRSYLEYRKFLDIFKQKNYTKKCRKHDCCDQPLITWLVHTGKLTDIKYEILPCSAGFASILLCKPTVEDELKSFTKFTWYPFRTTYFHQFKYYQNAEIHFNNMCTCAGDDFT